MQNRAWGKAFVSLTLALAVQWSFDGYGAAAYSAVSSSARDFSLFVGWIALLTFAAVSSLRPMLMTARHLEAVTFFCLGVGTVSAVAGIALPSTAVLLIGASVLAMGRSLVIIAAGLMLIQFERKTICVIVALALFALGALRLTLIPLPHTLGVVLFFSLPFVTFVVAREGVRGIDAHSQDAEPLPRQALLNPQLLIPPFSQLFISIFMFKMLYGFGLAPHNSTGAPPQLAGLTICATSLCLLLFRKRLSLDQSYNIAFTCMLAHCLGTPFFAQNEIGYSSPLVPISFSLFDFALWPTLALAAKRYLQAAPACLAWGLAMNTLGLLAGIAFGQCAARISLTNPIYGQEVGAVLILISCVYAVFCLRRFNYEEIIADPVPVKERTADLTDIDDACRSIAEQNGLTAREAEVLLLLAHGRNCRFIEKELVVSYNTVRTHVKHIYLKTDVHSQQELIDLIVNTRKMAEGPLVEPTN